MVKIELTKEQSLLYNELKRLSKKANQRILTMEREFKTEPIATKYLREKLEVSPLQAWTSKGRVKVNKSMTIEQMKATIKATKDYLQNPMSTKRGFKKARKKAKETIAKKYGVTVGELDNDEVNSLTDFFEDDDVNEITNYLDGSPVLAIIGEYIEKKKTKTYGDFYNDMLSYQQYHIKGDDVRQIPMNLIRRIYVKYIYQMNGAKIDAGTIYNIDEEIEGKDENELDELLQKVDSDYKSGAIKEKEYYYLSDKIIAAWRKIIYGE